MIPNRRITVCFVLVATFALLQPFYSATFIDPQDRDGRSDKIGHRRVFNLHEVIEPSNHALFLPKIPVPQTLGIGGSNETGHQKCLSLRTEVARTPAADNFDVLRRIFVRKEKIDHPKVIFSDQNNSGNKLRSDGFLIAIWFGPLNSRKHLLQLAADIAFNSGSNIV